jgi:predicted nucleotidyltransferase
MLMISFEGIPCGQDVSVSASGAVQSWRKPVHAVVASKRREIKELCRRIGVRRLDLFGSATGDAFDDASSDVDVLVDFQPRPGFDYFAAYFDLKEGLEAILNRPVDVITASSVRNPYLRDEIMRTREVLYAA